MRTNVKRRNRGFTLVELVVVVMILGILAAVAAPKLFNTSKTATDNSVKASLTTIRNAIDTYAANNSGALPGADGTQATFYANLFPLLRSPVFPSSPVGAKNNSIRIQTTGVALTGDTAPTQGWAYDNVSGQFICNYGVVSSDGVNLYSAF